MAEVIHRYVGKGEKLPAKPTISPAEKLSKEESQKLDREYRVRRNEALALRNHREKMLIAKARHELIPKELVERQAAFLVVALRQKVMQLPSAYARRLVNVDVEQARRILREAALQLLGELQDFPAKVTDPEVVEKFGEG